MQLRSVISIMAFALVAAWIPGAGAQYANSPQPVQNKATQSSAQRARTVHSNKTTHRAMSRRAKARKAKRGAYRPEYARNSVEVINGSSMQKVQFNKEEKPGEPSKSGPAPLKVQEVNGNSTSTRYFYMDKNQPSQEQIAANYKQKVVVGVESSNTRQVGGNKHPVVTGITSAGSSDETSANKGRDKVTTDINPKPKRAPYQP